MLLTNWLRSISKRCRSPRSRKSGLRSPLAQRRASTTRTYAGRGVRREIEVLEDRTLLTSTFDIDINRTVTEGDSGTVDAVLTVTRTGTTPGDLNSSVTVDYFTQDNSATTSDNDYLAISGTLRRRPLPFKLMEISCQRTTKTSGSFSIIYKLTTRM